MRYAILGDIHGNLEALEAALAAVQPLSIDRYLQVGDVVGYGADPGACIRRVQEIGATVVAGNHDWAVTGKLDTAYFNPYAREAVDWTRAALTDAERSFLEELPLSKVVDDEVELVHATLDQPELFDYIQTYHDAHRAIELMKSRVCFVGHSHIPVAFIKAGMLTHSESTTLTLPKVGKALINVGSVGQPRDENPLTACAVYDSATRGYQLLRVPYDIDRTAAKIQKAGLPSVLGERLFHGR